MAGGKRYKFTGSTIAVLTDFHADSPSDSITGITKANPAVVTAANHGRSSGDVVFINVLTVNTFALVDTDATGWGAWTSGGKINVANFSNFCELTGYNRSGGTSPEIPADSLCSTAAEYEIGLPDFGTTAVDFNFAPQTAIQLAIARYYSGVDAGERMAMKILLPNQGGNMVQMGFIQQTSEQVGKGGLWTGSMTIRNTGPRYDYV